MAASMGLQDFQGTQLENVPWSIESKTQREQVTCLLAEQDSFLESTQEAQPHHRQRQKPQP